MSAIALVAAGIAGLAHAGRAPMARPRVAVAAAPAPQELAEFTQSVTATQQADRLSIVGRIPFPLDPEPTCYILDNFGDGRSGGRRHEGIDLPADLGREVYAVFAGTLTRQIVDGEANASLSGNAWYLELADGTYYFYGHLSAFAAGLEIGDEVEPGQVIGYVGDTGNPGPGNYHLHFGVFPRGGAAVDPLPLLTIPAGCVIY